MNSVFVRFIHLFAAVFAAVFLAGWFYLSVTSSAAAADSVSRGGREPVFFDIGRVTLERRNGESHDFQVELAVTPAQRRRGLMFREHLAADRGMLFDFGPPRRISMWMKDTLISLDMLFVASSGVVVHIASRTQPHSQQLISSPLAVRYVLEVPAGTAESLGLEIGDRMRIGGLN